MLPPKDMDGRVIHGPEPGAALLRGPATLDSLFGVRLGSTTE